MGCCQMKAIHKKQEINIIKGDLFDNIEQIVRAGHNGIVTGKQIGRAHV